MGYVSLRQRRGRSRMGWAQDKVAILVDWRHGAVGKFLAAHKARRVGARVGYMGRAGVEGGAGVCGYAKEQAKSRMTAKRGRGRCMESRFGLCAEV